MSDPRIRILLVDDETVFLEGLKLVLESRASDMEIVGLATDGREAIRLAESTHPHIILMDVRMDGMDGVEATAVIAKRFPKIRIMMFTTFDDDEYVTAALKHGAIGYLLKTRPPMELIHSLRAVKDGILQIDSRVPRRLVDSDTKTDEQSSEIAAAIMTLTRREKDVLHLIAQALDNRQIADHLHVSEQTARNYISTIYSKLGTSNRMEIVRILNKMDF